MVQPNESNLYKMSKFANMLLAFKFSKLLNNREKLTGGEDTLQATPKAAPVFLGVWSVGHFGKKYSKFIRNNICL